MNKLFLAFLVLSVASNFLFTYLFITGQQKVKGIIEQSNSKDYAEYPYLSKRIFAEDQNDILINFIPLRQAMREYVEKPGNKVGVYFEYLPSGSSIGINDTEEVRLASLSKVPTTMAIYKQIARNALRENQLLTIEEKYIDKQFGHLWKKGAGYKIKLEEVVKLALTESDNTAHNLLLSLLTNEVINEAYDFLDIPKDTTNDFPSISPKNYSSILRSLYLSSYIPEEYSNKILAILTETQYLDKIPAGIPSGIKVAHKIGVTERLDASESTFTDCGIVYVPKRPYILCIRTKGMDDSQTSLHMKNISKMVYEYVSVVKGGN